MKISVLGASGAMGGRVIKAALQAGCSVESKVSSRDSISLLFRNTDVIIDFSCSMATESMLLYAKEHKLNVPMVIGTTGLSKLHTDLMEECSHFTQIFCSPNMSFLVSIMNIIVYAMAKLLDESYDVEIFESHHKLKKDAPSGTAVMLGKTIADARNREFLDIANFVRFGIIEQRKKGEIGYSVQRAGNVIGVHEVKFVGESESISIKHDSFSKEIYADGAVRAAFWVYEQKPGLYNMADLTKDFVQPLFKDLYGKFFAKKVM